MFNGKIVKFGSSQGVFYLDVSMLGSFKKEVNKSNIFVLQARYRQYFENEDPISPISNDSLGQTIIPMETQVKPKSLQIKMLVSRTFVY